MGRHICYQLSTATASGDTAKTNVGNIQLNQRARKILSVFAVSVGGAGITTLEDVTGRLEIESSSLPQIQPCQIPLTPVAVLTSGVAGVPVQNWPINLDVKGQETLTGYVTMDMALTVNSLITWGVALEVED